MRQSLAALPRCRVGEVVLQATKWARWILGRPLPLKERKYQPGEMPLDANVCLHVMVIVQDVEMQPRTYRNAIRGISLHK